MNELIRELIPEKYLDPANITCSPNDLRRIEELAASGDRIAIKALINSEDAAAKNSAEATDCILDLAEHYDIDPAEPNLLKQVLNKMDEENDFAIRGLSATIRQITDKDRIIGILPTMKEIEVLFLLPIYNLNPIFAIDAEDDGVLVANKRSLGTFPYLRKNESLPEDLLSEIEPLDDCDGKEVQIEGFIYILKIVTCNCSDGKVKLLYFNDVTELRKTQEKLKILSEYPLENPNIVSRVTADGVVEDVRGMPVNFFSENGIRPGKRLPDKLMRDIGSLDKEKDLEVKIGDRIFVLKIRISLVSSAIRKLYYHDVTDLRKVQKDLEETVEELSTAQDELKKANDELKAFAGAVSHDLKKPLTNISSLIQLLIDPNKGAMDDDRIADIYRRIYRATMEGANFIKDLLAFLKIDTSMDVSPTTIDLSGMINKMVEDYNMKAEIDDDNLDITIKDPLPKVKSHRIILIQIFQNLMDNAIKYIESERKQITIGCKILDGNKCKISIEDNGIGISPGDLEKIFQVFVRADAVASRKEKFSGTGIGLATVQKGLEKIGGSIRVESTIGEGSTFHVTLPGVILQEDE